MSTVITILRGHTHADLAVLPGTYVANIVGAYIRQYLTEYSSFFNKRTCHVEYSIVAKYARYNPRNGMLSIPIGFVEDLKKTCENRGVQVEFKEMIDYPLREIDLKMKETLKDGTPLRDRPWQVDLIKKCSEKTPGMKGLALQTGKGKTYSAIKSICNLGYSALVIAPGLADQWIASFRDFTDDPDSIYKIQEFKSLRMLMSNDWKPKVFVASVQTLQAYASGKDNYKCLPFDFAEFFKHYGIGVKVVDECHLNFHATLKMDLQLNVPYNLYCSATFCQTNKYANAIFSKVYPPSIRYGEDKYDKYVTVHFYEYSDEVMEEKCVRLRGYSHMRYEAELLRKKSRFSYHFEHLFKTFVDLYFVPIYKKGYKMLILCSTIEFIESVVRDLKQVYPQFNVIAYVGDASRDILEDVDIIVGTIGKAATGLDVKGLRVVYNTVSLRAAILTKQSLGRLRKIEGAELIYIDRCDTNLRSHIRHAQERKDNLKEMAYKFYEHKNVYDPGVCTVDKSKLIKKEDE